MVGLFLLVVISSQIDKKQFFIEHYFLQFVLDVGHSTSLCSVKLSLKSSYKFIKLKNGLEQIDRYIGEYKGLYSVINVTNGS